MKSIDKRLSEPDDSAEVLSPNGQSAYANDLKILTSYLINTLLKINEN